MLANMLRYVTVRKMQQAKTNKRSSLRQSFRLASRLNRPRIKKLLDAGPDHPNVRDYFLYQAITFQKLGKWIHNFVE